MHGFLWVLHKDHHDKSTPGFFEKNDLFFVIFAIPAIILFATGSLYHLPINIGIGGGITAYGFAYFVVHEIIIHQRFKLLSRSNLFYVQAIRRAHKMHHKHLGKEDGECFGMLWVPYKYFKEALRKK
jgi:beta-carotene 3-hydroxylase